jgi:putative exporter of polyketide antibiotics
VDQYFVPVMLLLAIAVSGFTVSSALRLRAEESSGRAESLLATGLSHSRWFLGVLLDVPQWLRNLSPFEHVPGAPVDTITVAPLLTLTAIAVGLAGIGLL